MGKLTKGSYSSSAFITVRYLTQRCDPVLLIDPQLLEFWVLPQDIAQRSILDANLRTQQLDDALLLTDDLPRLGEVIAGRLFLESGLHPIAPEPWIHESELQLSDLKDGSAELSADRRCNVAALTAVFENRWRSWGRRA
jgi:hypothetical protein